MAALLLGLILSIGQLMAQSVVDFTPSDTFGTCPPLTVNFANSSTGVNSYLWDFGDGNMSTAASPTHTYTVPGLFTVKLIGYQNGVEIDSAFADIEVLGPPLPTLSATPLSGCAPLTVTLDATSPGSALWSEWSYWGTNSGLAIFDSSATHTINWPGSYQFFFRVTSLDTACSYIVWLEDTIKVRADSCIYGVVSNILCLGDTNGEIDLTAQFGTPPYTYSWSNGATTEDLSGLGAGEYTVEVSDNLGTTFSDTFLIDIVGIGLQVNSTPLDCNGGGGTATVTATGGTPPYSYSWTTGDQTQSIGPVPQGGYAVYVTDNNGCTDHEVVFVEYGPSCYKTLSGTIYYDINQYCIQDPGEGGLAGLVQLSNGSSVWANQDGTYSIDAIPGTYVLDISLANFPFMSILCPASGSHSVTLVDNDSSGLDFALEADSLVQDLRVALTKSIIRPGFSHAYWLKVYNDGIVPATSTLTLTHDALADFSYSIPVEDSYDSINHLITWTTPLLYPGQSEEYLIFGTLPASVPLGTPIHTIAQVDPIAQDVVPDNNVDSCSAVVVGAYDPNDKQVSPAGEGGNGDEVLIENFDGNLRYTVRFQNTGTDTAFYVVIRDELDPDLDPASFIP
ncbi:MAG: PKD domain-containing protein, partial [Bacteroidota bacterium]